MEYQNKTIIVTGAGQGIGLCLAEAFVRQGARVVIAEQDETTGRAAVDWVDCVGSDAALFIPTDMSREESVAALVHQTLARFGRLDGFIHNAAAAVTRPVTKLSWDDWKRVLDTNLSGAFLAAKFGAGPLKASGGVILLIASTRALMSESDTEAYSASKAGLIGLTHALAVSLGPEIRVNCISPGWIDTRDYLPDPKKYPYTVTEADHAQHPCGRVGQPQDIAELALLLCGPRAGFITGQNFIVDGGMTRKMIYV